MLDCSQKRLAGGLLRDVQVAEAARQRGHQPSPFGTMHRFDSMPPVCIGGTHRANPPYGSRLAAQGRRWSGSWGLFHQWPQFERLAAGDRRLAGPAQRCIKIGDVDHPETTERYSLVSR